MRRFDGEQDRGQKKGCERGPEEWDVAVVVRSLRDHRHQLAAGRALRRGDRVRYLLPVLSVRNAIVTSAPKRHRRRSCLHHR